MGDVLLLIHEACTNINNYHSLRVCLVLGPVQHFTNSFNPEERSVGITVSILQIRSLLPSKVKIPCLKSWRGRDGFWSHLPDSRA